MRAPALLSIRGRPVDVRPTGERQPEQARHLVEGLAGGVVDGRAERLDVGGDVADLEQAGVAAADQQGQAGVGQRAVLELVDGDVRGQVVDAEDRLSDRQRVGLRRGHPHEQRAGQTWAGCHRDCVDLREPQSGLVERPVHGGDHRLEMRATRHLGHHTAEPGVLLHTRGPRVGQQLATTDDADSGFVAGRLDAENDRRRAHPATLLITSASAPLGW